MAATPGTRRLESSSLLRRRAFRPLPRFCIDVTHRPRFVALLSVSVLLLAACPGPEGAQPGGGAGSIELPPRLSERPPAPDETPAPASDAPTSLVEADLPPHAPWLRVFYGQDLRGEIEACGCPGSPTGGFARRVPFLRDLREALPEARLLEGPNALSRGLTGLEAIGDRDRARGRLILELLAETGVDAFFPGQSDLRVLPPKDLAAEAKTRGLTVVASNLETDALPAGWRRSLLWTVGDRRVAVLGLLGTPRRELDRKRAPTVPPSEAVAALRAELSPDVVVAFTDADERERRAWGEDLGVDVLLAPFEREEDVPEGWVGDRYELKADPLGRGLRRLDLVFTGVEPGVARATKVGTLVRGVVTQEGRWLTRSRDLATLLAREAAGEDPRVSVRGYDGVVRVDPTTDPAQLRAGLAALARERALGVGRVLPASTPRHVAVGGVEVLAADLPEDPAIVDRIDRFQSTWLDEIEAQLVAARVDGVPDTREYAGVDACVGCHPAEYAQWGRTAHVRAYRTLRERAEQRNPDCLACHATGFGEVGGFADPATSQRLLNVQCEACHGPMAEHAREANTAGRGMKPSPGLTVNEATCVRCHDEANSPRFDYEEYRPRGAHPLRGAPGGDR